MINSLFHKPILTILRSPEHGGDAVKGGGHPGDQSVSAEEAIAERRE